MLQAIDTFDHPNFQKQLEQIRSEAGPGYTNVSPMPSFLDQAYVQWKNTLPRNLQSDTPQYDLKGAFLGGLEPSPVQSDGYRHMYGTRPSDGMMLKNTSHPTLNYAIDADNKAGYVTRYDNKSNRYFSSPIVQADKVMGYEVRRNLFPGEYKFFLDNPGTTGMAAKDGRIILNPLSRLTPEQYHAVAVNEASRLFMNQNRIVPDFPLTQEQVNSFTGTAYEKDPVAMRQTIVGRIISGDQSAGNATPEQRQWAEYVFGIMNQGGK